MSDAGLRVNAPQVIHEAIDGEVIVINLTSGSYYSLKGSAAVVWGFIAEHPGIGSDELTRAVSTHYATGDEEVGAALAGFLQGLNDETLVIHAEHTAPAEVVTGANGGGAFQPPLFEKYTDMQDLVLLDPVHQVDETGWPAPNPDVAVQR